MKKAVKTFALSAMSVALLSGCILDDKFSDGTEAGANDPVNLMFHIYNMRKANGDLQIHDDRFQLEIVGHDNSNAVLDSNTGTAELESIKITPVGAGWEYHDAFMVNVSSPEYVYSDGEEDPILGTFQVAAIDGKNYDYSATASAGHNGDHGTIRFTVLPTKGVEEGKHVYVQAPNSDRFDATSLFNMLAASDTPNLVKIPTNCFVNANFSTGSIPMSISTTSELEFRVDNLQMRGNTSNEAWVYDCSIENEPVTTNVFSVSEELESEGWATRINTTNIPQDNHKNEAVEFDNVTVNGRLATMTGATGVMQFGIEVDELFKDYSQLVENGVVRFKLALSEFGGKTPNVNVRLTNGMSGDDASETNVYAITSDQIVDTELQTVEIKLADLFVEPTDQRRVDINLVRQVARGLHVQVQNAQADTKLFIADIELDTQSSAQ